MGSKEVAVKALANSIFLDDDEGPPGLAGSGGDTRICACCDRALLKEFVKAFGLESLELWSGFRELTTIFLRV